MIAVSHAIIAPSEQVLRVDPAHCMMSQKSQ
jgi:hypothetical protein